MKGRAASYQFEGAEDLVQHIEQNTLRYRALFEESIEDMLPSPSIPVWLLRGPFVRVGRKSESEPHSSLRIVKRVARR